MIALTLLAGLVVGFYAGAYFASPRSFDRADITAALKRGRR